MGRIARSHLDLVQMLWERCERDPDTGCWNWAGAKDQNGYGNAAAYEVTGKYGPIRTHRLAWILFVGQPDSGSHLHHKCENPSCCNPDHLELLTPKEHSRKHYGDTCPQGHGERHWYIRADGSRYCRECDRIRVAKRRKERRVPCVECGAPRTNSADYSRGRVQSATGLCRNCWEGMSAVA